MFRKPRKDGREISVTPAMHSSMAKKVALRAAQHRSAPAACSGQAQAGRSRGGRARLDGCSLMMKGLSTAAQMGAVKVSTIASFSGSRMTATRSAAAPQRQPVRHTDSLQTGLRQVSIIAQLGRAQFMMAP